MKRITFKIRDGIFGRIYKKVRNMNHNICDILKSFIYLFILAADLYLLQEVSS